MSSNSHKGVVVAGKVKHKEREAGGIPPLPTGTHVATPAAAAVAASVLPKIAGPTPAATGGATTAAAAPNGSHSARVDREQRADGISLATHDLPPVKVPVVHDATLFPKLGPGRADSSSLPLPLSARERERERERERDRSAALAKEKERERKRNFSSDDASSIAAAAATAAASKISLPSVSPRTHQQQQQHESNAAAVQRIASNLNSLPQDGLLRREPSGSTSARSDKDAAELARAKSEKKKHSEGGSKRSKDSSGTGKPTTRARAASEASANSIVPASGFGIAQRIDHIPVITSSPRPSDSDETQQQEDEEDAYADEDEFSSLSPEPTQTATEAVTASTAISPTAAAAIVPPLAIAAAAASSSPDVAATTRRKVGPSVQQAHQLTARSTQDNRDYEQVSEDIEGSSSALASAAPTPKAASAAAAMAPAVTVSAEVAVTSSSQASPSARRNGAKKIAAASPAATSAKPAGGSAKANKKKPAAPAAAAAAAVAAPVKSSAPVSSKPVAATTTSAAVNSKKKPTAAATSSSKSKLQSAPAVAAPAAADDEYGDTDWRSDTAKALPEHKESSSPSSASTPSQQPQPNFRLRAGSEHDAVAPNNSTSSSSDINNALPKQLLRFTLLPETISSFTTHASASSSPSSSAGDLSRSTTLEFLRACDEPLSPPSSDLESLALDSSSGAAVAAAVQSAPTSAWESVFSTTLSASSSSSSVFTMDAGALQSAASSHAAPAASASAAVLIQLWDTFYSSSDSGDTHDESSPRNALERTLLAEFTTTLGAIHAGDGSVTVRSVAASSSDIPSTVRAGGGGGAFERTVKIAADPPPPPVILHSAIKAPRSSADPNDPSKSHQPPRVVRFFHKVEVFTIEPRMRDTLQATVQLPQTTHARPPSQPKQPHHHPQHRAEEKSNHHSPSAHPSLRLKPHPPVHPQQQQDTESGPDLAGLIQPDAQAQPRSRRGSGAAAAVTAAAAAFSSPVAQSKKSGAAKPKHAAVDSPVIPPLFPLGAAAATAASGSASGGFVRLSLRGLSFAPFSSAGSPSKSAAVTASWRFEMLLLHQGVWARLYSSEPSPTAQWNPIVLANPMSRAKDRADAIWDAPLLIRCYCEGSDSSSSQIVVSLRSLLPEPLTDAHVTLWPQPLMLMLSRAPAPTAAVAASLRAKKDAFVAAGPAGRLLVTFLPPSTPAAVTTTGSAASSRRGSGNNSSSAGHPLHIRK